MKNEKTRYFVYSLIISLLMAILLFGYFMFIDKGVFVLKKDFRAQQLDMNMALNNILRNASGQWAWNYGLGTQVVGAFSFYVNFPVSYLAFLFPAKCMPYLIGWIYIIRYTLTAGFSYLYIYSLVKESKSSMIGAILYAYSGFSTVNLTFHFGEVVMLFPLLLLCFDRLVQQNKKTAYILMVFASCFSNFYMFMAEAIFLIIFFLFRYSTDIRQMVKKGFICFYTSLIGVAMSGAIFIPSVMFNLNNSRSNADIKIILGGIGFRPLLNTLKGILIPAEVMGEQASVWRITYDSCSLYLPMIGLSFAIAYFIMQKKDKLSKLVLFLVGISFIPFFYMIFCLYTDRYYRWWFMLELLLCVMSANVMAYLLKDDKKAEKCVRWGVYINLVLILGFLIFFALINRIFFEGELLFEKNTFIFENFTAVLGLILVLAAMMFKGARRMRIICVSICAFCFITSFMVCYRYHIDNTPVDEFMREVSLGEKLVNYDDQYRYRTNNNNIVMASEISGTGVFSSTISSSIREFEDIFDFYLPQFNLELDTIPGLNELMGAKYEIERQPGDETYSIVEKKACPIGFSYNSYVTREQLDNLDVYKRGIALLAGIYIDEDVPTEFKNLLESSDVSSINQDDIERLVDLNNSNSVKDFKRTREGFECKANYDDDRVVWFSIPYDKGWKAYIDGIETEIYKSAGMMSIVAPDGDHKIVFKYTTPGLLAGIISMIFGIMCLVYIATKEVHISKDSCGR